MGNIFFFPANTQFENLGDGIIGSQLLKRLRNCGDVLVDDRPVPEWYVDILEIDKAESVRARGTGFKRLLILAALQRLLHLHDGHVYLALKPGHVYGSGSMFKELARTGFFMFLFVLRVRIIRYGASIGPFSKCFEIFELIKSKMYWHYTVRDGLSLKYCESIGLTNAIYCPDMAFSLDRGTGDKQRKYKFGLSFRSGTISDSDRTYTDLLEMHLLNSRTMIQACSKLLFVSQVKRDDLYVASLRDKMDRSAPLICYQENKQSQMDILRSYDGVELVLSNRLHVLLFAASRGAIPIPLLDGAKHSKIVGIFQDENLADLIFNIKGVKSLDDHLSEVMSRACSIQHSLSEVFISKSKVLAGLTFQFQIAAACNKPRGH
jgi:polysaccharide pyruvyl transferase WcaK-like protein